MTQGCFTLMFLSERNNISLFIQIHMVLQQCGDYTVTDVTLGGVPLCQELLMTTKLPNKNILPLYSHHDCARHVKCQLCCNIYRKIKYITIILWYVGHFKANLHKKIEFKKPLVSPFPI